MNFSVPATSANLGSGFDCLGLSLDFRNNFRIKRSKKRNIQVYGEGSKIPKLYQDNLFIKIFNEVFFNLCDQGFAERSEFSFIFNNNIPISRGLGSSSALVVGAIFSAFKLAGMVASKEHVLNLALKYEGHPDNITPTTFGGFNVSLIDNNDKSRVVNIRKRMPNYLHALVVIPNKPMSTKKSRNILPENITLSECVFNLSCSSLLSAAFFEEKWEFLKVASQDCLHQKCRMNTMPLLFNIQDTMFDEGVLMSTLSGSGSSIFGMCYEDDTKRILNVLESKFSKCKVLSLNFDNDGIKID